MYVIVHTASQWLTMDTLESEFSETFLLGDVNQCLYIVDVKSIIATMICMLPKKKWGKFFDRCLDKLYLFSTKIFVFITILIIILSYSHSPTSPSMIDMFIRTVMGGDCRAVVATFHEKFKYRR